MITRNKTTKRKRARKMLASYINPDGTRKETSIEARVRKILENMGLFFVAEKAFTWKNKTRYFDFWVTDGLTYSVLIECDGDYFHATAYKEGECKRSELTKLQKKNVRNDEFKNQMAMAKGIPLLRFTEGEIKRNAAAVKDRIAALIDSQTRSNSGA